MRCTRACSGWVLTVQQSSGKAGSDDRHVGRVHGACAKDPFGTKRVPGAPVKDPFGTKRLESIRQQMVSDPSGPRARWEE